MKVTVIIPMYNESNVIRQTALTLSEYMVNNFSSYELIFSDDGSSDGSKDIVEGLNLPCVKVLCSPENKGKGNAVRRAMLCATGDVRIFTDADLAYGTDVIKQAYGFLLENEKTDILIGSRNIQKDGYEGYTLKRRLMSKAYIKILCLVGGFKLSDSQCGFKAFRAQTADEIFSKCAVDGFAFDFEAIIYANMLDKKISEMPVKVINHRESSVKPLSDSLAMLKDLRRIKKNVRKENKK